MRTYKNWNNKRCSMPLGNRIQQLDWETVQSPAVYEVVCKNTGRRYVGCSRRPDLRRSVHLYWLKHNNECVNGNVFFGVEAIDEDITAHGVESFYFDIISSFSRDVTDEVLYKEESRIKAEIPSDQIYNAEARRHRLSTCRGSRFVNVEPEMERLHKELTPLVESEERTHTEYYRERTEFRKKHNLLERDALSGAITSKQRYELSEVARVRRNEFCEAWHEARKLAAAKRAEINALNTALKLKWTSSTLPALTTPEQV